MKGNPIGDTIAVATRRLAEAGVDSPRLDARLLLAFALGIPGHALFTTDKIAAEQLQAFHTLLARRTAREPLAYITGVKEFFSLEFAVGSGVLIPRPETELLMEECMRYFSDRDAPLDALDLGTGSGCLIVTFLKHYTAARGTGVDISADALVWARRNVERHDLSRRCSLNSGDWKAEGAFDVVFVNPPYLKDDEFARAEPEIGQYEPKAAFAAGCDGLASYRALAPRLRELLRSAGLAFVEIGIGQNDAVAEIFTKNGLEICRIAPDLSGTPRCVVVRQPDESRPSQQKTVGMGPTTR